MNGAQHYAKAEELLAYGENMLEDYFEDYNAARQMVSAQAQAHATLALVAAQVDANDLGTWSNDRGAAGQTEWGKAVTGS